MEEKIIKRIIHALPDDGVNELSSMLDDDCNEEQVISLLRKYDIDLREVLGGQADE